MLKLNTLADAIELEGLLSLLKHLKLVVSQGLMQFAFLLLQELGEIALLLHSCLFDLLSLHPHIEDLPLLLLHKLVVVSDLAEFKGAMQPFGTTRYLKIPSMKFLDGEFQVRVDNDSSLLKSKAGMSQLVMDAMKVAAQVPGVSQTIDFSDLFEQWLNLNGLKVKRIEAPPPMPMTGASAPVSGDQFSQTSPPVAEVLNTMGAARPNPVAVA